MLKRKLFENAPKYTTGIPYSFHHIEESLRSEEFNRIDAAKAARELAESLRTIVIHAPTAHGGVLWPISLGEVYLPTTKSDESDHISEWAYSVEEALEASRFILRLEDNWDEEESPGYNEDTWKRATTFVRDTMTSYWKENENYIAPPKITPGPDGSIDVRWKAEKRTLLINFPANEEMPADFFGSDRGTDTIKGTLDLSSQNPWILMWLMR